MITFNEVQFGEILHAGEVKGQIAHVRDGVAVRNCCGIETSVIAAGTPGSVLLLNAVKGQAQGLEDLLIMPMASRASNSAFTSLSLSGSSRRAFAKTGGPVVAMWWRTPCDGGAAVKSWLVTSGYLASSFMKASSVLTEDRSGCAGTL